MLKCLPPDLQERLKAERRQDRQAAGTFIRFCAEGDVEGLHRAAHWLDESNCDAWRFAMLGVARLPDVSEEIKQAFVCIWVPHKMLALTVGSRPVLARALRLLMPRNYSGPPLTLYRGTTARERRNRHYNFSWTTDPALARTFAENWARPKPAGYTGHDWGGGGVVLQTVAPAEAILLVRERSDYYDENEVVVDPYKLGKVIVRERLLPPEQPKAQVVESSLEDGKNET
jgi:hypothetical protein